MKHGYDALSTPNDYNVKIQLRNNECVSVNGKTAEQL